MAWRDKLQPASFRGAPFQVDADEMGGGRRVQVHEYPQRDVPYAEDLGRAAREISVTAFVVGDNFLTERDALLGALEQSGAGTLVHPWFGSLQVVAKDWRVRHDRQRLGVCEISLNFVEAGVLAFPASGAATRQQTGMAADVLRDAALDDFEHEFGVAEWPGHVRDAAMSNLGGALDKLSAALDTITGPADALRGDLQGLLDTPRTLGERIFGLYGGLVDTVTGYAKIATTVRDLLRGADGVPVVSAPAVMTPSRAQIVANATAVAALSRRVQLVQAAGLSATMPVPVYDDAVQVRDGLTDALDVETLTASDAAYPALVDLRAKVYQDLTTRARDAARLRVLMPTDVVPSLALAYDLYEDAAREDEIVTRNGIAHPGFIPVEPLRVLTQ